MEKWNVIGYQHVEFDTSDGKHISGTFLYLCRERKKVVGSECCKVFVTPSKIDCDEKDIPIGGSASITFNRYGKPESVSFSY